MGLGGQGAACPWADAATARTGSEGHAEGAAGLCLRSSPACPGACRHRPLPPPRLQGEKPHAGFPEASYHEMAERLARAGHKVRLLGGGSVLVAHSFTVAQAACAGSAGGAHAGCRTPVPLLPLPPCRCRVRPRPLRWAPTPLQVVVVEQTETPDMLKTRNEERTRQGLKKVRACGGGGSGVCVVGWWLGGGW